MVTHLPTCDLLYRFASCLVTAFHPQLMSMRAFECEGLFRIPGSSSVIKECRDRLNRGDFNVRPVRFFFFFGRDDVEYGCCCLLLLKGKKGVM